MPERRSEENHHSVPCCGQSHQTSILLARVQLAAADADSPCPLDPTGSCTSGTFRNSTIPRPRSTAAQDKHIDDPLVPHAPVVRLAPHGDAQLRRIRHRQGHLHGTKRD